MLEIWMTIQSLLLYIGPLAIIAFGLLLAWGTIKWIKNLGVAVKGLSESPGSILFALLLIAAGLYFWFLYLAPLFN